MYGANVLRRGGDLECVFVAVLMDEIIIWWEQGVRRGAK